MARLSRDLLCRRRLRLLDRLGLSCGWFRELSAYDRGITMQECRVRYTVAPMEAAKLRGKKVRRGGGRRPLVPHARHPAPRRDPG